MKNSKLRVLAVVGPTASGKTGLGIELCKRYGGEVISADSMQIYKGLDIASAKPSEAEMQGIPHHLIGVLDMDTSFSVADYVALAGERIREISSRGKLPVVVGGTGLYVDSLLGNVRFAAEGGSDEEYRAQMYKLAEAQGCEALHAMLAETDPEAAASIHPNNVIRVVRALEVSHVTGRTFSELKAESRLGECPYEPLIIGINFEDRAELYARTDRRVDIMVERGLVAEAEELWRRSGMATAANAIGYKELIPYFEGTALLEECIDRIKQSTRRYAKRQLTWLRRNEAIHWLTVPAGGDTSFLPEKAAETVAQAWGI
ncbi:MAG: tRNA (adenosine(37)-N6)-dimethylallyltransferase MiaA [Ruminococcus sp.]|nr:tRNA (adenosine(37)-N6)-dimethylallyltransferase MiaA [Ruminococcus sp.]